MKILVAPNVVVISSGHARALFRLPKRPFTILFGPGWLGSAPPPYNNVFAWTTKDGRNWIYYYSVYPDIPSAAVDFVRLNKTVSLKGLIGGEFFNASYRATLVAKIPN